MCPTTTCCVKPARPDASSRPSTTFTRPHPTGNIWRRYCRAAPWSGRAAVCRAARRHSDGPELMGETRKITLTVNGSAYEQEVEVRLTLADFLRHQLGLTGTHLGCEHGVCGACTILLDGRSARSCLMLAVQAHEHAITTVEGLAPSEQELSPLQEAFRDNHGLQCGFCTPGMLITLEEFLRDNPNPTEREVRVAISGNLCRCTGYQNIVAAALDAAKRLQSGSTPRS